MAKEYTSWGRGGVSEHSTFELAEKSLTRKDESLEHSANLAGYQACPASLDILKISMPPAVKLAAVFSVRLTLDPDIIAAEIVEDLQAALAQFAEIASDLKR